MPQRPRSIIPHDQAGIQYPAGHSSQTQVPARDFVHREPYMASIGKPFFDVRLFSGRFIGLSIPIFWAQVEWLKHTTTRVPYSKS
jgi:hypothetical protein